MADHDWPDELVTGSKCAACGLDYGRWTEGRGCDAGSKPWRRRMEALIAEDERRMREQSERFDASLDKWRDRMEGRG